MVKKPKNFRGLDDYLQDAGGLTLCLQGAQYGGLGWIGGCVEYQNRGLVSWGDKGIDPCLDREVVQDPEKERSSEWHNSP